MNQRPFNIQFLGMAVLFAAILLQGLTHWVKMKPLEGYENEVNEPVALNFKTYYDGTYQDYLTEHAKRNTGFREFFIRSYNQMAYSCFNIITNENIVEGSDRELFLKMYLNDLTGSTLLDYYDNVDEAKADAQRNVEETQRLMELLRRHGTQFLFVFAPSKTLVYPEYLPESYRNCVSDFSLQEYYIELFKEKGIPHIDFLNYFRAVKDTVAYPLYPRTGTHWAQAVIPLVADSIYRKLEALSGFKLPEVKVIEEHLSKHYSIQDGELEASMNLLFPLNKPAIPNPVFILTDTLNTDKPNLVVVGDSYFTQLRTSPFVKAFHHEDFWLYNRTIYSSRARFHWKELKREFDAVTVLEEADIVMAVFTAPMFYNYMFGFARTGQELLEKGYFNEEEAIDIVKEMIMNDSVWYDGVKKQAEELNITTEECLSRHVRYWLDLQKLKIKQPEE